MRRCWGYCMRSRSDVYRARIYLMTPLITTIGFTMFDGLLAHLEARRQLGDDFYNLPTNKLADLELDLPLRKLGSGRDWFYATSASIMPGGAVGVTRVRKRPVVDGPDRRRVHLGKGRYKAYDIPFLYRSARYVDFLFEGDAEEVEHLLAHLFALGKKRAEGFGTVRGVSVEPVELASAIQLPDGRVTRPIPARYVDISRTGELYGCARLQPLRFRPPYWAKRGVTLCTVPGERYVLNI